MRIGLLGYGKMGRMVEAAARERGHQVLLIIDPAVPVVPNPAAGYPVLCNSIAEAESVLKLVDVMIEFTRPETVVENIKAMVARKVPLVVGTTGWLDKLEEVQRLVEFESASLLWSSNFSLGVNLFYKIVSHAAELFDHFDEYDVGALEVHHNKKADSPSGTAKTLAERILSVMKRKTTVHWDYLPDRPPQPGELHFASLRYGAVPGTHSVFFDSTADTIEITHQARSREGFARGAVRAAEWLLQCPGAGKEAGKPRLGIFTMDDVLKEVL
ncbi:MAG: 4-hydroxy-tetrahydrodipicolinate reductase [Treponemataceae bacterium]|nr:4-hydroxy-tetrahydrodipicolinate reductase [Treponemataceae bacterium]